MPTVAKAPLSPHSGTKGRRTGGGLTPSVDVLMVHRVAERVAGGMPQRYAIAIDSIPCSVDKFVKALKEHPVFAREYDRKIGEVMKGLLDSIPGTTRSTLPVGNCWLLERAHGLTANPKTSAVQVNIAIGGVEIDVSKRASAIARARLSQGAIRQQLNPTALHPRPGEQTLERTRKQIAEQAATVEVESTAQPPEE